MKDDSADIEKLIERGRTLPVTSSLPPIRRSAGLPALVCIIFVNHL